MAEFYTVPAVFFLSIVFASASVSKVVKRSAFVETVLSWRLFPRAASIWVASLLPLLEAAAGLGLLSGMLLEQVRGPALVMATITLSAFTFGQLIIIRGRTESECGCFGSLGKQAVGGRSLIRTAGLTAIPAGALTLGTL